MNKGWPPLEEIYYGALKSLVDGLFNRSYRISDEDFERYNIAVFRRVSNYIAARRRRWYEEEDA